MNVLTLIGSLTTVKKPTSSIEKLIGHTKENGLTPNEIFELAKVLAQSGVQINHGQTYDIPSTGGPSSLSTLLCPLFLKISGKMVLKLGVPGRPAGGIDVLSLIKGYKVSPAKEEIEEWLKQTGYVHFLVNDDFAPLDKQIFNYRKANDALNIPSLVVASILSKKIAVGVTNVGLDIRVSGFGNFGKTWNEAKKNAKLFIQVAKLAKISAKCFITNGTTPQQPFIGRGEALLAIKKIISGEMDYKLKSHLAICYSMASSLTNSNSIPMSLPLLKAAFEENVLIQKGSVDSFYEIAERIEQEHTNLILASDSGFLVLDLDRIRSAIVRVQQMSDAETFTDPCGIILLATTYDYVRKGDIICSFRCIESEKAQFKNEVISSISLKNELIKSNDFEVII